MIQFIAFFGALLFERIARIAPFAEICSWARHSLVHPEAARAVREAGLPFSVHGPFGSDGLGLEGSTALANACARVPDLGEQRDLSREKPEVLGMVRARFQAWKQEMDRAEPRGPLRDY